MNADNRKNWIHSIEKYIPLAVIAASIFLIINFFTPVIFLEMPASMMGVSATPGVGASYLNLVGGIKVGGQDVIHALPYIIVMLIIPVIIFVLCVILIKNNDFKNYNNNNKKLFIALFIVSCSFLAAHIALYAISGSYMSQFRESSGAGYVISSMLKWGPTFFGVVDFICISFILFVLFCKIWGDRFGLNEKMNNVFGGSVTQHTETENRNNPQYNPTTHLPVLIAVDTSANMGINVINEISNNISNMVNMLAGDGNAANKLDLEIIEFNNAPVVTKHFADRIGTYGVRGFSGGQFAYMGAGLNYAADEMENRLRQYDSQRTDFYKPWMFIISAGITNDDVIATKQKLSNLEIQRGLNIYPVGLNFSKMDTMKYLTNRNTAFRVTGASTYSIFSWIKDCISLICSTQKGAKIKMPPLPSDVTLI